MNIYKQKFQKKVQKIATLIDSGLPCLATGKFGNCVGGHLYGKGAHEECRFNLHNIHRQDFFSNGGQKDDKLMWLGILLEYGEEYRDMVQGLKGKPSPKIMNNEYQGLCSIADEIIKELDGMHDSTPQERISLRTLINNRLGIYGKNDVS